MSRFSKQATPTIGDGVMVASMWVCDREMNGTVDVYQRDDGNIYLASGSRTPEGPMVVNGWCRVVSADIADDELGALVEEGLRVGEEPGREILLDDRKELLMPLLKLAKVRSFAAFARGTRGAGVDRDSSGAYVVIPTDNRGVRSGFMFIDQKVIVPAGSGAEEIGRAVRLGLASSSIAEAARSS